MNTRLPVFRTLVCLLLVSTFACSRRTADLGHQDSGDFRKLQNAGCSAGTITRLQDLKISTAEIDEIILIRNAGTADETCVSLVELDHRRSTKFSEGRHVAELRNAGMSDQTIIQLHKLRAIDSWTSDIATMRRAGISDDAIEGMAKLRLKDSHFSLSGKEIAKIKNAGYGEDGIVRLLERGLNSGQVADVTALRKKGRSEEEIMRTLFP
jgi:hypothetical protein